ncbi:MAG: hypothetical protein C5B43_01580 [Verrucomicrobia bacterium]|nr:MAG: hypothetical protein C5B43_01580 [Verrucomicrobiota bacterium]
MKRQGQDIGISFKILNTTRKKLKPSPLFDAIETDKSQFPTAQTVNKENISPKKCSNNTNAKNFKAISQRTASNLMILEASHQATTEEIRKEIKRAEALGLSNDIIDPIRLILGQKEDATYEEILWIAKNYYGNNQFYESRTAFQRIENLYKHSLKQETKIQLFEQIIECYEKDDKDPSEAIIYYLNEILSLIDNKSHIAINIYFKLYYLHLAEGDGDAVIHILKQLLAIPAFHTADKNTAFDSLLDLTNSNEENSEKIFSNLYKLSLELANFNLDEILFNTYLSKIVAKLNECIDNNNILSIEEKVKGYRFLIEIYKNNKNENAIFETFERICSLPNLSYNDKTQILFNFNEYCLINNHKEKSIEYSAHYCDHVLRNSPLEDKDKFDFLKELSLLHLNYQNLEESVNIYKKSRSLFIWCEQLIKNFLENPQIGLEIYFVRIEKMAPKTKGLFIEVLAWNPTFWYGPFKLSNSQLDIIFETEINEEEVNDDFIANLFFSQYLSVSQETYSLNSNSPKFYLNQNSFFSTNSNILAWNILPQREEEITPEIFSDHVDVCISISQKINHDKKDEIEKYLYLCINSKYSENNIDFIVRRVVSIIDVLRYYFYELTNNESLTLIEKETINTILIGAIDIMCDGSKKCHDLALATLTDLENYLKLAKFPQHQAQILINMFKLWAIQHKLTDNNQPEQTETYFFYTLQFNKILGLSLSEKSLDEAMFYPDHAILKPQEEALTLLSTMFSAKALIDFTSSLSIFNILFEKEKNEALKEIENQYLKVYDLDDEEKIKELTEQLAKERKTIESNFYLNKAIQIFSEAFFLLKEE